MTMSRIQEKVFLIDTFDDKRASYLFSIDGKEVYISRKLIEYDENDKLLLPDWLISKNGWHEYDPDYVPEDDD